MYIFAFVYSFSLTRLQPKRVTGAHYTKLMILFFFFFSLVKEMYICGRENVAAKHGASCHYWEQYTRVLLTLGFQSRSSDFVATFDDVQFLFNLRVATGAFG